MPEAPDLATAWNWLLERKPGTRGATQDSLLVVVEAAHAELRLRSLYPFPTHGTLHFLRSAPPWADLNHDDLPFILYGGPPLMGWGLLSVSDCMDVSGCYAWLGVRARDCGGV
ncbi:DUF6193 family natural product biosynthesis protein, partial [Streptomyces sp. NPDC001817]|uniref:DUF6193 family natural product biosynthesis protein n=1 Tax=Streptomyces sp. NPDC001817 TaxID=3154398 RepID=UPI00332D6A92